MRKSVLGTGLEVTETRKGARVEGGGGAARRFGFPLGVLASALALACSKQDEQPPPAQPGQVQAGYPQQPGYPPQQPGYPAQAPAAYPAQQPAYPAQQPAAGYPPPQQPAYPAAPAQPGAAGAPSQPSPIAFPCTTDAQCLSHRCNVAAGKCAWPCQSQNDCQAGFQCMAPTCIPGAPAQ